MLFFNFSSEQLLASIEVNLGRKTPEIDVANDSKYDLNCMERLNIAIETADEKTPSINCPEFHHN